MKAEAISSQRLDYSSAVCLREKPVDGSNGFIFGKIGVTGHQLNFSAFPAQK
jgi:hypothetical protein